MSHNDAQAKWKIFQPRLLHRIDSAIWENVLVSLHWPMEVFRSERHVPEDAKCEAIFAIIGFELIFISGM